jgi:hypothetical protein
VFTKLSSVGSENLPPSPLPLPLPPLLLLLVAALLVRYVSTAQRQRL